MTPFPATAPATPIARALVVTPVLDGEVQSRKPESRLDEAVRLTRAIGVEVLHAETIALTAATDNSLFGRQAMERLGGLMEAFHADLLVIDRALTSLQQRTLERSCLAKLIDRPTLILETLGARTTDPQTTMQAELAALQHQRSRKIRCWTRLDDGRGAYGFDPAPGAVPGDALLERHRRLLTERIATLKRELNDIRRAATHRRAERRAAGVATVALIGYAGSGVSTLRNRLGGRDGEARLPSGRDILLVEGLPVLADLPHGAVKAFGATLDAVRDADLILHVRNLADPEGAAGAAEVEGLLSGIGIDPSKDPRIVELLNKADRLAGTTQAALALRIAAGDGERAILLSATSGLGIDDLLDLIDRRLATLAPMTVRADGQALA